MADLVDQNGNKLKTAVPGGDQLVTDGTSTPPPTSSGGRRYNYVVFNMCLALLAVLPLLASIFMKWPLK